MRKVFACFLSALLVTGILSAQTVANAFVVVVDDCPHENAVFTPYNENSHCAQCENCGETIYQAHEFTGHSCTVCGYRRYLPGDGNRDGVVNDSDLVLLRRTLAGWNLEGNLFAMDYDNDGSVTTWDAVLLERDRALWPTLVSGEPDHDELDVLTNWNSYPKDKRRFTKGTSSPGLEMEDVSADLSASSVSVPVKIINNPGIITLRLSVSIPEGLTLVGVSDGALLGGWETPNPTIGTPYTLLWIDALTESNYTEDGTLVTLTFEAAEKVVSDYEISITVLESRNIDGTLIAFPEVSSTVSFEDASGAVLVGDLNGDQLVTTSDAIYLLFHAFFPELYPVDQAVDYNGDQVVTTADAIYLLFHAFFPELYPLPQT